LTGLSIGMIETVFVELDESTPRFDEWKWWLRLLKYRKWIVELNSTMASMLGESVNGQPIFSRMYSRAYRVLMP
jgi:hypothetical protein